MAEPRKVKSEPNPRSPRVPGGYEPHTHSWEPFRVALRAFLDQLEDGNIVALGMNMNELQEYRRLRTKLESEYRRRFPG